MMLLSPWVDLTPQALLTDSMRDNAPEKGGLKRYGKADSLPVEGVRLCQEAYASAADRATPAVSPYLATAEQLRPLGRQASAASGTPYAMRAFLTW